MECLCSTVSACADVEPMPFMSQRLLPYQALLLLLFLLQALLLLLLLLLRLLLLLLLSPLMIALLLLLLLMTMTMMMMTMRFCAPGRPRFLDPHRTTVLLGET